MIIGVTGTFGSGKDSVSEYLAKEKGFSFASTGDIIREYLENAGLPSNRDTSRNMASKLNNDHGSNFLLKEAIKRAKGKNIVISGIREPGEADYFRDGKETYLIAVDAPIEIRFQRMRERGREGDPQTVEELKEKETREMFSDSPDKSVQNISYCIKAAKFKIDNSGSKEELYKKVEKILEEINHEKRR